MDKQEKGNEESLIKIETKENDSLFMDINEVKKILSLGAGVYNFVRENNIPYLRVGSNYRIHRQSFYKWIEKNLIHSGNVVSYNIKDTQTIMEIIDPKHEDVICIFINNIERIIDIYIKKDTTVKVKNDIKIKKIIDHYKGHNFRIQTHESLDNSPTSFLDKQMMSEFKQIFG